MSRSSASHPQPHLPDRPSPATSPPVLTFSPHHSLTYLVPLSYAIVGLVDLLPLGHVVAAVEAWELGESVAHVSGIAVAERVVTTLYIGRKLTPA